MVELPDGKKMRICSAVSTEYWRVTDGQTDGQTDRHSPRYAYASRSKNRSNIRPCVRPSVRAVSTFSTT